MTTPFNFSKFCITSRWWDFIWGGGHTLQDLQGWRTQRSDNDPDTVLVGRRGQPCCFSARPYGDGENVDVAFYYETPNQVSAAWKSHEFVDASYKKFPLVPGWGLQCLKEIRRMEASECAASLDK